MIRKKIKLLFSSLAILTLLVSAIPSLPVAAEPTETFGIPQNNITADAAYWTPSNRLLSVVYARSLARCMGYALENSEKNATKYVLTPAQATTLSGWKEAGLLDGQDAVGALIDPSGDGVLSCNNENNWVSKALTLWKFNSNIEALCAFGWYRVPATQEKVPSTPGSYTDCVNGSGGEFRNTYIPNSNNLEDIRVTTNQNLFFARLAQARGVGIVLDAKDTYSLYYRTFTAASGCKATRLIDVSSATPDQKQLLETDSALTINEVEGEGTSAKSVPYIYQLEGKTKNDTVKIAQFISGRSLATTTNGSSPSADGGNSCKYIAKIINQYSVDFLAAVQKGEATTEELSLSGLCDTDSNGACATQTCGVQGIGWIICPVFNFLSGVADGTYGLIEGFLVTDIRVVDTSSGTYTAWQIMRNLANIGFVIVFLIIVFSQLTGAGITNYGVKKMLPRLIIAAILVNVSFFIAQLAVDISNILGGSLRDALDLPVFDSFSGGLEQVLGQGNTFTDITVGIMATQAGAVALAGTAAAVYFGGIGLLIPVILAAVIAVIMTLLILIARQAIVILLVVISPLAFLAMLLPNTEGLFKQWRKIFVSMLLLYPAVALLFAGSQLAAAILIQSLADDNTIGKLTALAIMVLPLFALPAILKGSLNAVPAIGNLAQKIANSATSGTRKLSGQGMKALGERAAASNSRAAQFASRSLFGRSREGRSRQTAARRSFEEPRIKDIQERWANENMMNDAERLQDELTRHGADSLEGQAAIGRLAQMGEAGRLANIREKIKGDPKKMAAYDKATAPHFAALKAKDYRAVFSDVPGASGKPSALQAKYSSAKAVDMHTMTDEALEKGAAANSDFKQTLVEALRDPDQARYFSKETRKAFAANVAARPSSGGGSASPLGLGGTPPPAPGPGGTAPSPSTPPVPGPVGGSFGGGAAAQPPSDSAPASTLVIPRGGDTPSSPPTIQTPQPLSDLGSRIAHNADQVRQGTTGITGAILGGVGDITGQIGSAGKQVGSAANQLGDASLQAGVGYGKVQAAGTVSDLSREAALARENAREAITGGTNIPPPVVGAPQPPREVSSGGIEGARNWFGESPPPVNPSDDRMSWFESPEFNNASRDNQPPEPPRNENEPRS